MTAFEVTGDVPLACTVRGGSPDCVHYGSIVAVDRDLKRVFSYGNPNRRTFERSLCKPFQAIGFIEAGLIDAFGLSQQDLAVIAGSHSGSNTHIRILRQLLHKGGISEKQLRCGRAISLEAILTPHLLPMRLPMWTQLHCDCSGEHIAMLLLAKMNAWPLKTYHRSLHHVARFLRPFVDSFTGVSAETVPRAFGACGRETFLLPLFVYATAMIRLGTASLWPHSCKVLTHAIKSQPVAYAGHGRVATELLKASNGSILGKDGADGLYAFYFSADEIAIAVKVADGGVRAVLPVLASLVKRYKLLSKRQRESVLKLGAGTLRTNMGMLSGSISSLV